MDVLYILLISIIVLCLVLALCICCFANSRYCHCIDIINDDEDSQPIKTKSTTTRELNREYYANSNPTLESSKFIQQTDFVNNGHQYSPLLKQHSSSKPLDDETTKTTFYTSPGYHSTVSETSSSTRRDLYPSDPFKNETTSYSTTRNVYPAEPFRNDATSYSTTRNVYPEPLRNEATSYSTTRNVYPAEPFKYEASYSTRNEPSKNKSSYSTEISYSAERALPYQVTTKTSNVAQQPQEQIRASPYPLRKSASQTSLYENN